MIELLLKNREFVLCHMEKLHRIYNKEVELNAMEIIQRFYAYKPVFEEVEER